MKTFVILILLAICSACGHLEQKSARLIYKYSDGSRDTVTMQMKVTGDHLSLHFTKEELAQIDIVVTHSDIVEDWFLKK